MSYAAGKLAQRFAVLPDELECLAAAAACYHVHRDEDLCWLSLPERLSWISEHERVIDLDAGIPHLTKAQLHSVPAFLRTNRCGRREILFTQAARDRFLPDFRELVRDRENTAWFSSEQNRKTVRRSIRQGKKDSVYRFFLPGGAERES